MKRRLLIPPLLIGLFASVLTPPIKGDEVECYYSNKEQYEECSENPYAIKKPKYPLEITYVRPSKKTNRYVIWLITTSEELGAGPGSVQNSLLQIKSNTGKELEFIHGIWYGVAGGFAAKNSFVIPSEDIVEWKKYTINSFVTYKISYIDKFGEIKKIAFQQHIKDASRRKGSLFADLIEDISKLKPSKIRAR